jgi:hypothetical protein
MSFCFSQQKNVVGSMLDSHAGGANASILNEELRSKIEENARLHKQVTVMLS